MSGVTGGANFSGGSFALAAGQSLKGFGAVVGNMAVPAGTTVAPGGSIGTLNEIGDLVLDGTYLAEVNSAAPGQKADLLAVSRQPDPEPDQRPQPAGTNTYDGTTAYTLATYGGTLTGTFGNFPTGTEAGLPAGYTLSYGDGSNDAIRLTPTPVPEPGTLALTGLAVAGAAGWWKRRKAAV